jgi:hypothetical protein
MDEIQEQVEELRGLDPTNPVARQLLTTDELLQRVKEDFLADYTEDESRNETLVLAAFGLLDPEFNILEFYTSLLAEQVAGFYDDDEKAMYVVRGEGFQGPERLTYSHEYTHALQDQAYDFNNGLKHNEEACEAESQRCAALQALIEGDATVAEIEWLTNFASQQDISEIQEFYNSMQSPVYDNAPPFIREDFTFPYREGQSFVNELFKSGGWNAVDAAYRNPPVSTEQILHPERYPDDPPVEVTLPDLAEVLGEGWNELDRDVLGEWKTFLILAQGQNPDHRLNERTARQAAEGWGGDAYVFYHHPASGRTAMVLTTAWDSVGEAREYASAFRRYAIARFGDPTESENSFNAWETDQGTHTFRLENDRTIWILAVDAAQAEALWGAIN